MQRLNKTKFYPTVLSWDFSCWEPQRWVGLGGRPPIPSEWGGVVAKPIVMYRWEVGPEAGEDVYCVER